MESASSSCRRDASCCQHGEYEHCGASGSQHGDGGGDNARSGDPLDSSGPADDTKTAAAATDDKTQPRGAQVVPKSKERKPRRIVASSIPTALLENKELADEIERARIPSNYNLEIHKTIWRVQMSKAKKVALQMPEGLLMFASAIASILNNFAEVEEVFVLGEVTYGACCIDDFTAKSLGADFLVHYGHSCLVPVDETIIPCMYVFVTIDFDVSHAVKCIRAEFDPQQNIALAGTIQFTNAVQSIRQNLSDFSSLSVPQSKPLSPGEVLGCTAPALARNVEAIIFVADGRFHLEAIMIANPTIPAYRYDPYSKTMTREKYDHVGMRQARKRAVERAMQAKRWGLVLGTLGRQGSPYILRRLEKALEERGMQVSVALIPEVTPEKLAKFGHNAVDVWVQIACPRLSIDWGEGFEEHTRVPVITPYEADIALGKVDPWWKAAASEAASSGGAVYPMDYYAKDGGEWNSSYHRRSQARARPSRVPGR